MLDFLSRFDGTGRAPRQVQIDALKWASDNWAKFQVHAVSSPVGSGKSAIARAIQIMTNSPIINPSNMLIDQYVETYPNVNFLKGKRHYNCTFSGLTCGDWIDVEEQEPCEYCPYQFSKAKAFSGEATFFNPLSLYHLRRRPQFLLPESIVVDEAHLLGPMLIQLCSKRFPQSTYQFPADCQHETFLSTWLGQLIAKLEKLIDLYHKTNAPKEKIKEACSEFEQICIVKECLDAEPENYAIWFSEEPIRDRNETFLNVKPVRVPRFIVKRLLACQRLVLLSGTLLKTDIEDLATGREYSYLDLPSPIPKENRPILYRPFSFPVNAQTDPVKMVREIEKTLEEFPNQNTIIHTTYARAKQWQPHFKNKILTNTPEDKIATLERFKKSGGVWLASGCSEGIDLKGDICRVNFIPHLIAPNLGDPVVKKWMALPGGQRKYALETIKTTVQQYGRSNRDPKDYSITIVSDPRFSQTVSKYKKDIPAYFTEAIKWSK